MKEEANSEIQTAPQVPQRTFNDVLAKQHVLEPKTDKENTVEARKKDDVEDWIAVTVVTKDIRDDWQYVDETFGVVYHD